MPAASPVILILGAGPRVGQAVAQAFHSKGYKVALASRSLKEADSTSDQLNITSDFANPDDVANAFTKVRKALGIPSVVVYNGKLLANQQSTSISNPRSPLTSHPAAAVTFTPPADPFAIPLSSFTRDTTINTTSAFVAAQQAAQGFAELPDTAARSFFYTGNILNVQVLPSFLDAGMGKAAAAHMMAAAAAAYQDRGFKYRCH